MSGANARTDMLLFRGEGKTAKPPSRQILSTPQSRQHPPDLTMNWGSRNTARSVVCSTGTVDRVDPLSPSSWRLGGLAVQTQGACRACHRLDRSFELALARGAL